jgi:DNA polymerase-3 subunit delta'
MELTALTLHAMALHPLIGHRRECGLVGAALRQGRLPQMLLVSGPAGVGKQRFALWVAQLLLCESPGEGPCGSCRSCLMVGELTHPDLHWFMPLPRPKAAEADRQVEELAGALADALEERRRTPLNPPADGMAGHFIATARLLQRRAALTPVTGKRKVFIVAEADRLVPQESSPEAANAVLKLLEEPPRDSYFVLTTVDANRLLPTVRSRLVPLRLGRLPDAEVERFLAARSRPEQAGGEIRNRVRVARGCIGRALALGDAQAKASRAVDELLTAVATGAGARAERALKQGPWAARGDFTAMLDLLHEGLSASARAASGAGGESAPPAALRTSRPVRSLLKAAERVAVARETAQGNVNPQLLLAVLADDLAEVL